ncbi:MAG: hypothetical protein HYY37_06550 [Candidatus Aenigmarchaeota archaeon]|nr:hypothetical protein [Candidatus Aenigmarchaeota archaeon]
MKGVSPLIAFVMLIVIAVVVVPLVLGWYTTVIGTTQNKVGNVTKQQIDCTAAEMSIQDVYIDLPTNRSRVSVKNTGYVYDVIVSAVMLNRLGENASRLTAVPINLSRGDTTSIEFNLSGTITTCGNFSKVQVVSLCKSSVFESSPKGC